MRAHLAGSVVLLLLAACGGGDHGASTPTDASPPLPPRNDQPAMNDTIAPRVRDLGVDFAPYDPATGRAGTFDFRMSLPAGPLGPFGRMVSDPEGRPKALPSYDYFVPPGTVVRAPFDGVVSWVRYQQDAKDYEMLVSRSARSPWWFDYDHIAVPLVDSGATVRAGQPIGVVREFTHTVAGRAERIGFVELMIGNYATKLAYCPLDLAEPAMADSLRTAVRRLYTDWRALGHQSPDTAGMVLPGCYTHTAVP